MRDNKKSSRKLILNPQHRHHAPQPVLLCFSVMTVRTAKHRVRTSPRIAQVNLQYWGVMFAGNACKLSGSGWFWKNEGLLLPVPLGDSSVAQTHAV